jgi:hypothetical protein
MLYLATGTTILEEAFQHYPMISLVADEARLTNAQILQAFLGALVAPDVLFGMALPPQVMPEMHIDFSQRKLAARIHKSFGEALRGHGGRTGGRRGRGRGLGGRGSGKGGRGSGQGNRRPHGDPHIATWHACVAVDNAMRAVIHQGLKPRQEATLQSKVV